ncbi:MAG: hypothetical protein ACFB3T_11775, partial [Geminicoccaceae bacterium]
MFFGSVSQSYGQLYVPPEVFVELYINQESAPERFLDELDRAVAANPDMKGGIAVQAVRLRPDLESEILQRVGMTKAELDAVEPMSAEQLDNDDAVAPADEEALAAVTTDDVTQPVEPDDDDEDSAAGAAVAAGAAAATAGAAGAAATTG